MRQTLSPGRLSLVSFACAALVAACGGGGGGGDSGEGRLQVITFSYPGGGALLEASTKLNATASSGLPVSFRSGTPTTCTVAGDRVTLVAAGECLVIAEQPGGTTADGVKWAAADATSQLFNVLKARHTSLAPAGAVMATAGETVNLSPVTSAGVPASYTSATPAVCTVSGSTLTLHSLGLCDLTTVSGGDAVYAAFSQRAFVGVDSRPPFVVQRGGVSQKIVLSSADSTGRPLTYATSTPAVCSLAGRELTLAAGGLCSFTASAGGAVVQTYSLSVDPRVITSGFDSVKLLTLENGTVSVEAGSAIDGGWCGGRTPSNCSTTMAGSFAAGDYTIRPVQNDPAWNAGSSIAWSYFNFLIDAPRTAALNADGTVRYDLTPFQVPTETTLFATFGIDSTMYQSGSRLFVRLRTGHAVPQANGSTCYVTVSQQPDMPSADVTSRLLNLADFAITENCGLSGMPKTEGWMFNWGVTAASKAAALNELRTYGIRRVEFSPTSVNTTRPRPNADGSVPAKTDPAYVLPNSILVIGPITVQ